MDTVYERAVAVVTIIAHKFLFILNALSTPYYRDGCTLLRGMCGYLFLFARNSINLQVQTDYQHVTVCPK